jgi:putative ABC transport system substrate-binding protein
MRRRDFFFAGATAWPLGARAAQAAMPVIFYLQDFEIPPLLALFRQGLAEAGYAEGKNLVIEYRVTGFKPELRSEAARDLVRLNVDVIFAVGPELLTAASNATTSIPIVAVDLETDPLAKGYVKSLARPGGNITGIFLDLPELIGKGAAQRYRSPEVDREAAGAAQRDRSQTLSHSNHWHPRC